MTIADTIYDTINDNWGNGGYAGATPAIDTTETQTSHDEATANVIEVRHYTLREQGRPANDTYVNRQYTLDVYISTKTSSAQLKLLYDEVEYLLRNTAMTGLQLQQIDKDFNVSHWEQGRHSVVLQVTVIALLSSGAVTSAAGVTDSMQALLMYGAANAAWVPLALMTENSPANAFTGGTTVKNVGAQDLTLLYQLCEPTAKGSLKLYISGVRIGLLDADAGDYVAEYAFYRCTYSSVNAITGASDTTDYTSPQAIEKTFTAVDVSAYNVVLGYVSLVCTDASEVDLTHVSLQCYYYT